MTYSHVGPTAGVSGLGDGVDKLPTDPKVAQLDVTVPVQEDVGGLDVWGTQKSSREE